MIYRIVKLTIKQEHTADFEQYVETLTSYVRSSPGCLGLQLLKDKSENSSLYFTYSQWTDEDALNSYRKTEKFSELWSTMKQWFAAKAEAWSTQTLDM